MRSLASSITTLFPLITTIPILFCVFWGGIFRSRSFNAYNINTQKWMLLEDVRHTCLVNSMESSSTRFMKGSKPQRVPSTWKIFQHQALLQNYSITHPPQPIIWLSSHTCTSSKLFHPLTSRPPLILRWTLLSMNFFNSGGWAFDIFPGLRGKSERIAGL